jgi:hypothetical protein
MEKSRKNLDDLENGNVKYLIKTCFSDGGLCGARKIGESTRARNFGL